jgi:hypothetical protein
VLDTVATENPTTGKKPVRIFTISENESDVEGLAAELADINRMKEEYLKY